MISPVSTSSNTALTFSGSPSAGWYGYAGSNAISIRVSLLMSHCGRRKGGTGVTE